MNQSFLASLPAPSPALQACVIIPARDECDGIETTLDCFARQLDLNGNQFPLETFEILLLANNCHDETAAISRAWGQRHASIALHVIEAEFHDQEACIGHVRQILMDLACQRLQSVSPSGPQAICSTDADTRVSPFWLAHTLAEMTAGARAVGGRIFLHGAGKDASRRTYLLDTAYRLLATRLEAKIDPTPGDPAPRHFHFFGASMAICPALFAEIGGLPEVHCLEDMALELELRRRDHEIRHSPAVQVWTSARISGRVETGLSTQLGEWGELGHNQWLVPSGEEIYFKAQLRRSLRDYWAVSTYSIHEEADELMLCPQEMESRLKAAPHFGAIWEQLWNEAWENPAFRNRFPPIPVECALEQLRFRLEELSK